MSEEEKQATLEELMEFPARMRLRAVGDTTEDFEARCAAAVVGVFPTCLVSLDSKPSSHGNFMSVRLVVDVETADQLRALLASLNAVEGMRVVL